MLNLVEWGLPAEKRHERLAELAKIVMQAADISQYRLEQTSSVVYGDTIDVMYGGIELGSGVMGPHFLDGNWGMSGPGWESALAWNGWLWLRKVVKMCGVWGKVFLIWMESA